MKLTRHLTLALGLGAAFVSSTTLFAQHVAVVRTIGDGQPAQPYVTQEAEKPAPSPVPAPKVSAAPQATATAGGCGTAVGCDSQIGCGGSLFGGGLLGGRIGSLIKPSDKCFDDFISPMTNPVFFEDPRGLTEARFIFLNHQAPAAVGGGDVRLYALQLRAKLSENVSLIATKDGYVDSSNPVIQDGWADLSAGLKFNLLRDHQCGRLVSAGFTFELPTGEAAAQQGNGDGELNLFLTAAKRVGQRGHFISAGGWRIPMDGQDESQSTYWSNHFDYQVTDRFYMLTELNWYHWTRSGGAGIAGVEGLDLFNFGSTGVAGNDIVTAAVGMKFKPGRHQEIGAAYEFPVTDRQDILENRFTFDWIIRY